jgi:hypothetical protein
MKPVRRRTFTVEEILHWADVYRESTGRWPNKHSGPILLTKGLEKWSAVDLALREGLRGLTGGSSLAQLLSERRGRRHIKKLPPLSEEQILRWADEHRQRTGAWPTSDSGTIPDSGREQWRAINVALHLGARTLPGGSSLARLLGRYRGKRSRVTVPLLTEEGILAWCDAHFQRTGKWPNVASGPVEDAPGEDWRNIDGALRAGSRRLLARAALGETARHPPSAPPAPPYRGAHPLLGRAASPTHRKMAWPQVRPDLGRRR